METLDDLAEKLAACTARDKQIREWQKIFKVGHYTQLKTQFAAMSYTD